MAKTFLDYYRDNLHYIRSSARDFAAEFPKIASRLEISAFDCEDPYIERLLEGTAYLAAKVDEKISAGFPRLLESIMSAISPRNLFLNPSSGVVLCNVNGSKIPATGVDITTNDTMEVKLPVSSTPCKYSTCWPVRFLPLKLNEVKYITNEMSMFDYDDIKYSSGLELGITTFNSMSFDSIQSDYIDFYINMTEANASMILWQLMCDMKSIIFKSGDNVEIVNDFKVELPVFEESDSYFDISQAQFAGITALQNFFIYPDMFKFVRIHGIRKLFEKVNVASGSLIFAFTKRRNELLPVINRESIMFHCLPVINLFRMNSSRGYSNDFYEYHIVPNNVASNDYEVYNVESIKFFGNANDLLLTAKPFYYTDANIDFNHNYDYFAIHRKPRSEGIYNNRSSYKGCDVFASVSGENWQAVRDEIVQYSAELICTNRDLPLFIKADSQVMSTSSVIESGVFVNAPTKPLSSLVSGGGIEEWEKVNHIMLNISSILWKTGDMPVKIISNIIKSYSLLPIDDTERIVSSILSIESEPAVFRYIHESNGIFYEQGWRINVTLSESKINDVGFFTFACVLWQFFKSYVQINSHLEFNVYSETYGLLKQWTL